MKKYISEFIGTFTLVLFGCGTAVVAGDAVGALGIAFAFGFALIAMAYGIGPISGCHINPAVSLGFLTAGKMTFGDFMGYVIAQCLGAIVAAYALYMIASGKSGYDIATQGLGQNGWGPGMFGEYSMHAAMIFEILTSLLFVIVILGSTQDGAPTQIAGLAIGITLVVIHIFGIQVTGVSVNPARSLGPALFVGGQAMQQLWMFIGAPLAAGLIAGILYRAKIIKL